MSLAAKLLSVKEVKDALVAARFEGLIGATETEEIDFKEQPYQLATERQKFSLLEDIASFANHLGGLLVIGCRTIKTNVEGDVVEAVRPVSREKFDFDAYRSLINEHIHPVPKGIEFYYFPSTDDPTHGLGLIEVKAASDADSPHLISHIVSSDTERKLTTRYALITRTGARNNPYPVESVHGLIQIGKSVGGLSDSIRKIETRLSEMQASLDDKASERDQITLDQNRKAFIEMLPGFLKETGFEDYPAFVMAAFPSGRIEVRDIYDGQSAVSSAFDNPPELRENGFDLSTGHHRRAEIIDGNVRRKSVQGYKAVQLSVSGRLIAVVPATEDFLAWATNRKPGKGIAYRAFVLTEVTYIFASLVKSIFGLVQDQPEHLDIMVALRNSFVEGQPPLLGVKRDHGPWGWGFQDPLPGPKSNLLKAIRVPTDMPVERLAFETRAALYHRFGFTDEAIPYASLEAHGRRTDPNEILNPNQQ